MLSVPILETTRLTLRPLGLEDVPLIQSICADRQIADTTFIVHPYPDHEAQEYVSRQLAYLQSGRCVTFAIAIKPENTLVGVIEIGAIEELQAEIGFWLAVKSWGQGYMSEALAPVVEFSFEVLALNRLYAYHMARNPASGKVLQKNGFSLERLIPRKIKKWGIYEDLVLLSINR